MAAPKDFSKLFDTKKVYRQQYAEGAALHSALPFSHSIPVVGYCLDLGDEQAVLVAQHAFDGILALNFPLIVFANGGVEKIGTKAGGQKFEEFLWRDRVRVVTLSDPHYEDLWRACDVAFCFEHGDVYRAHAAGVVPIVARSLRAGVEDYDPVHEKGNAFVYGDVNAWQMVSALVRAAETYKFPFDWKYIVKNAKC